MDRIELRQKFASRIEKFRLEEFETDVYLRRLSALARARLADRYKILQAGGGDTPIEKTTIEVQCRIISECLVDEHGARLYGDEDLQAIASEFPSTALDALAKRITDLSGLGATGAEAFTKNSIPTPSADLPSA